MRKVVTIIIGLVLACSTYGQTKVNKRIMLDSLQNKVAVSDTASMLSKYALSSEVSEGGAPIGDVRDEIADSLNVLRSDLKTADSDTIPIFIFGIGSGASADTANFNNGRLIGAFYNEGSDTLQITALRGVLVAGTGTETIAVQVSWDVNLLDGTPIVLNTSAYTVTSMTSGDEDTSFNNNGIPPNVWVWGTISGASKDNKPTALIVTLTGYRRNRSY